MVGQKALPDVAKKFFYGGKGPGRSRPLPRDLHFDERMIDHSVSRERGNRKEQGSVSKGVLKDFFNSRMFIAALPFNARYNEEYPKRFTPMLKEFS